jgi:hypothetical protein
MVALEKGCFYSEPGGEIYYYDGDSLHCPGINNSLHPTTFTHTGLSSLHDLDVDVRKFEKVDPIEYTLAKTNSLSELVLFIKEHSK